MAIDKEVKWTLTADDEATPKVVKLGKAMQKELVEVSQRTAKTFAMVEKASKSMQNGLSQTQKKVEAFTNSNEALKESLDKVSQTNAFDVLKEGMSNVSKVALVTGAAIAGVAAIDKLFIPLNEALFKTNEAILKTSFAADKAFSEFVKGEGAIRKVQEAFFRLSSKGLNVASKGILALRANLNDTKDTLNFFIKTSQAATKITVGTSKAFIAAAKHTELFEKGLAGAVTRAGIGATAFSLLGTSLLASDGIMNKMAGVTLIALALALGGLVVFANQALNAIGNLAIAIGTNLTEASERQIEAFSKAETTTFAFNQTIASYSKGTEEAAAATADWTAFQVQQTEATGTQAATMRAMIAETISATEAAHLNVEQQKLLIQASIDLSERAHKPQIETLEKLIGAMNGAGQGVIALGLHVNDAAVEHSKLTQAQKDNFKSADDATKAQTRLAVILEQAGRAAGFATMNADLYSKAIKLQKNAQETLNAELGRGAVIINGEYRLGLATATNALTNFFKPILPGVGFLQALGGRLLQVTGFLTKNLLMVTLLTSSYKALNILLAKGFAGGAFGKQLPFINKSLGKMAKDLGATTLKFNSLKNVAKAGLQIIVKQSANGVRSLLGLDMAAKLTAKTMGGQLVKGFKAMTKGILTATRAAMAFIATPIGATIAAVTVVAFLLFKAFQKLEEETGIFTEIWGDLTEAFAGTSSVLDPVFFMLKKIGNILATVVGAQIKFMAAGLALMVGNVFRVILAFQKLSQFLPESMRVSAEAMAKTQASIDKLNAAAKKLALGAIGDIAGLFIDSAHAVTINNIALQKWRKELEASSSAVSKFEAKAKKAFEFASEFTPKINLTKFKKEATDFETTLINLQGALEDKKITLLKAPKSEDVAKALAIVEQKIADSEEAIQGIRLKKAQEIRNARLSMVSNELAMQNQMVFSIEQEIKQMRLDNANETRSDLIQIETQRLLEQRGLETTALQEGTTIKTQAILEANAIEIEAFRNKLMVEKELALTMEEQKLLEVANLRAALLQGTSAGAEAGEDAEILKEQQKIAQLNELRAQELISEQQFQLDKMNIIQAGKQRSFELELQMENQRIAALGLSPEALQAKLDMDKEKDIMALEALRVKLANKQLTEEEFAIAGEQIQMNSQARANQTRQQFLQQEIQQNRMRGESFKATLKEIELAQQQHGQVMGTIKGIQSSQEFGALTGALGNLSSLRNSESKKEFEIGKKAAMAQVLVSTFMSATLAFSALAGIPIVGPVLGGLAAAAAVAAGMMNLRMIKKQKFGGGGAGGGGGAAPKAPTPSASMGGQADEGMDAVPRSLAGKSFILSANERVVQPEANKDLTGFLAKVNNGDQGLGGTTVNITVQGNISSQADARIIADAVVEELRDRSERGEPVISSKGIVNG